GELVFAGPVLPADARRVQRVRGVAGRAGARAVAGGGAAVASRDPAALVDRVRGGAPRARRPVPGPLLRSRHRASGRWRERRLVDLVAARGGGRRHGAAVLGGGLGLPERDAAGLGREDDAPAVVLLERMAHELPTPEPRTAGELYAFWLKSPLAAENYPATLAVWTRTGDPVAELRLARLDLRPPLLAALVRSPDTRRGPRVERLPAVPGVHNVLVAPLPSGDVLTVGVGPRTLLIAADRVARFLQGDVGAGLPYVPSLSLPSPGPPAQSARVIWTRTGWSVRGERRLELPGGVRHVHLRVDLQQGGPWALLVRGALVVVLDAVLLGTAWLASLLLLAG